MGPSRGGRLGPILFWIADCGLRIADLEAAEMTSDELKLRTKQVALDIIDFTKELPSNRVCDIIAREALRSGKSVGANYRSACRAKSSADFISKMGTVEEEADETGYWLELLVDSGFVPDADATTLISESEQLVAI